MHTCKYYYCVCDIHVESGTLLGIFIQRAEFHTAIRLMIRCDKVISLHLNVSNKSLQHFQGRKMFAHAVNIPISVSDFVS